MSLFDIIHVEDGPVLRNTLEKFLRIWDSPFMG